LKPKTEFFVLHFKCLSLLVKVKSQQLRAMSPNIARAIGSYSYRMEYTYCGISSTAIAGLHIWRLFAHLIALLSSSPLDTDTAGRPRIREFANSTVTKNLLLFASRLQFTRCFCVENNLEIPQELDLLSAAIQQVDHREMFTYQNGQSPNLLTILTNYIPKPLFIENMVKKTVAIFKWPLPNIEKPFPFTAQFPLRIDLDIDLEYLSQLGVLFIKIELPDSTIRFHSIKGTEFSPTSRFFGSAHTTIELTHHWNLNEVNVLRLWVVKVLKPDLLEFEDKFVHIKERTPLATWAYLPISRPFLYHLLPRD